MSNDSAHIIAKLLGILDSKQLSSTTSSDEKKVKEVKISNSHAPWMRIAIREGIEWKGKERMKLKLRIIILHFLV